MSEGITHVGLDVHKASISVAMLLPRRKALVEFRLANEPKAVKRLARKLKREAPGPVSCCYEAGPCGYVLQRQLHAAGLECRVIAPSLIPMKPGERIKTDRRDARKLAELLRGDLLTEVAPPTPDEEAVRDLCRCREAMQQDLTRAKHRLGKFLLRRNVHFPGKGKAWTQIHRRWLKHLRLEAAADRLTLDNYLLAVEQREAQVRAVVEQMEQIAQEKPYQEPVALLRCFRGIDTVSALTLVTELHGFLRFRSARALMAYLGLVPGEHSSGDNKRRGAITKAGNSHVRRVLVEAAWHYRHKPAVGKRLRKRREGQPPPVIAVADGAQQRLYRRYRRLVLQKSKEPNKAIVAVARELAGFIWAALQQSRWAASGGAE